MNVERRLVKRSTLAIYGALSVACILTATACRRVWLAETPAGHRWLELVASLLAFISFLPLPRRPVVFYRAHRVDHEYGVSILERYFFSWVTHLFSLAKVGSLGLEHVPRVSHHLRVRTLKARFTNTSQKHPQMKLWALLIRTFVCTFGHQWLLISIKTLCGFGGRVAIYQLLRILERDSSTEGPATFWALGLGASLMVESLVGTRQSWLSETRL